jgi:hypothetical protein
MASFATLSLVDAAIGTKLPDIRGVFRLLQAREFQRMRKRLVSCGQECQPRERA